MTGAGSEPEYDKFPVTGGKQQASDGGIPLHVMSFFFQETVQSWQTLTASDSVTPATPIPV